MNSEDPYDLQRFVTAQEDHYDDALEEIQSGAKKTHWMWYIFPQFAGLGQSMVSARYAIRSVDEAKAYLAHPVLGARLIEIARATLNVEGRNAREVFGSPDDLKLKSCSTLFAHVSPDQSVFHELLNKYFGGLADGYTLRLLAKL